MIRNGQKEWKSMENSVLIWHLTAKFMYYELTKHKYSKENLMLMHTKWERGLELLLDKSKKLSAMIVWLKSRIPTNFMLFFQGLMGQWSVNQKYLYRESKLSNVQAQSRSISKCFMLCTTSCVYHTITLKKTHFGGWNNKSEQRA